MISREQVRAARAYLDWDRNILSGESGVSVSQIANFETGRTDTAKQSTLQSLEKCFMREGLDFVSGGVIKKDVSSYILDSYTDLLEDISQSLPEGGEVLKHCVDDRRSTPEVVEKVKEMRKAGITERITIADDNDYITGHAVDYRQIDASYAAPSEVVLIYLDKVAFVAEGKKVVVIKSDEVSKRFRADFEYWWKKGKTLDGT